MIEHYISFPQPLYVKATLFGAGFLKYFEKNQIVFLYNGIIRFNIFLILPLRNNGIQFMSPQDESEGKSVNDNECNI